MKLTGPQLRELKRLSTMTQRTFGAHRARVQNTLVRFGLANFISEGSLCEISLRGHDYLITPFELLGPSRPAVQRGHVGGVRFRFEREGLDRALTSGVSTLVLTDSRGVEVRVSTTLQGGESYANASERMLLTLREFVVEAVAGK